MIALSDLRGDWVLTRRITDLRAGIAGRFEGRCRFVPDADGLRQEEEGLLHYGAAPPMLATRSYLWRAAGDGLEVLFADGRPFHGLGPGRLADRHHCAPDIYDVRYDFTGWPVWTQEWAVTGPRKDARILSRFAPAGGAAT